MEHYFADIFTSALTRLKDEISKFNNEADVWRTVDGVTNPAGVLTKHLVGNLNFTIGATVGKNGYVRNREYEFAISAETREELVISIEKLIEVVKTTLGGLTQPKLDENYPLEMFGQKSTAYYLIFFYGHFNYHLGQINYLRRILEH
jgi:Protein of unknown function (DUF1572)